MEATKPNLVIVPVGSPIDKFIKQTNYPMDVKDHWRWVRPELNYNILVVKYSDEFEPEFGSYDELFEIGRAHV